MYIILLLYQSGFQGRVDTARESRRTEMKQKQYPTMMIRLSRPSLFDSAIADRQHASSATMQARMRR